MCWPYQILRLIIFLSILVRHTLLVCVNIQKFYTVVYNLCMGQMEQISKRKSRNVAVQKIVLQTIATAGLLSVAIVAPNVIGAMVKMGFVPKPRFKESIKTSRQNLVKAGLLAYAKGFLSLTPAGETKLRQLERLDYKTKKPKRWDKKWRVLIFDISEQKRDIRDKVRLTLVAIGFVRLQNSVWVYPYDCEDLVTLLKSDFKIGKDLLYLIVDSIENDGWLIERFGLSI